MAKLTWHELVIERAFSHRHNMDENQRAILLYWVRLARKARHNNSHHSVGV